MIIDQYAPWLCNWLREKSQKYYSKTSLTFSGSELMPSIEEWLQADMKKHPSSLAALAEIFWGFGGNIFKWLPLFCDAFGGKQKKLDII